jgi:hypothetical protein
MACFVGLDVSQRQVSLGVLDQEGKRLWRGKCATDPAAITATLEEKVTDGTMTLGAGGRGDRQALARGLAGAAGEGGRPGYGPFPTIVSSAATLRHERAAMRVRMSSSYRP